MNSSTVRGAHRLDMVKGRHRLRSTSSVTRIGRGAIGAMKATAVLAIAVSLGLVGTGGTYAYLNASVAATPASTISAGTASLNVSSQNLDFSALAPGASRTGTFTITNTGDVPLQLSAAITATMTPSNASNPFTVKVANGACPATGIPAGNLNTVLAAGTSTSACLVVTLPETAAPAAQSASAAISATISGVQQ